MHIHLTPAALAKAKALGVVAAALTAGGAGGMIALSQVSNTASSTQIVTSSDATSAPTADPSQTPTATPTPTATESATDVATAAPTSTAYALPSCPADVKNHGAYVSGVAHSAPKGKGGEHGKWVSQAAHSDCGKSSNSADKPEPNKTESPETEGPKPEHSKAAHTQVPKPTKTVEAGTSTAGSAGSKHKSGHDGH